MTEAEQALIDLVMAPLDDRGTIIGLVDDIENARLIVLAERFHPMRAEFDALHKACNIAIEARHALCEKLPSEIVQAWFKASK